MALLFVGATAARTSGCVLVPDPEPVASPPVIVAPQPVVRLDFVLRREGVYHCNFPYRGALRQP